jgi:hypothetical protein
MVSWFIGWLFGGSVDELTGGWVGWLLNGLIGGLVGL